MSAFSKDQQVGKYLLVRVIGRGGMGEVWEAMDPVLGRRAALKVLTLDLRAHPGAFQRFVNEARAANQINHPGVVQIFDFGLLESGTPWLAMEYLQGEPLFARLGKKLGVPDLWIVLDLASVLAAAHAQGIVHRDLKPQNVMLTPDPSTMPGERAKLLDFGIAKLHDEGLTQSGVILGTPAYMALEQIKSSASVDGRADVFALGVIAYQMVGRRLPHLGDTPLAIAAARMSDPIPPLNELAPGLPAPVTNLVMRMLEMDPALRPSLIEVEATLRQALGWPARQSGYHAVVRAAPPPLEPEPLAAPEDSQAATSDMPAEALARLQAAAAGTPSGQRAVGEISPIPPVPVPVPQSLSSMPSVPMPVPPVPPGPRGSRPPEPRADAPPRAPTHLVAAALASPSAPTFDPGRPGSSWRRFLTPALSVGVVASAALTLWIWKMPRPGPITRPEPAQVQPAEPKPARPATPPAATPATTPDGPAPAASAPTQEPVLPAAVPPAPKSSSKPAGRSRAACAVPTSACLSGTLTDPQRRAVLDALHESQIQLCPEDSLTVRGGPKLTVRSVGVSTSRREDFNLALQGALGQASPADAHVC
jgi:serine/threonine-protein kinase